MLFYTAAAKVAARFEKDVLKVVFMQVKTKASVIEFCFTKAEAFVFTVCADFGGLYYFGDFLFEAVYNPFFQP